jgi:hypothetical protein
VPKAIGLAAVCELIVEEKSVPRRLINVLASVACYRDSYCFRVD